MITTAGLLIKSLNVSYVITYSILCMLRNFSYLVRVYVLIKQVEAFFLLFIKKENNLLRYIYTVIR